MSDIQNSIQSVSFYVISKKLGPKISLNALYKFRISEACSGKRNKNQYRIYDIASVVTSYHDGKKAFHIIG